MRAVTPILALSVSLAACAPFQFEAQDVFLHHDPEADELTLGIVYEGLHGPSSNARDAEAARETVGRIAAGERVFMLLDWPWILDLDSDDPETEWALDELSPDLARRVLALEPRVSVDGSGLFTDARGRLGAWQRLRFAGVRESLAVLNAVVNEVVAAAEDSEVEGWDVDARTRELFRAHARRGDAWMTLAEGGFEVRVPLSRAQGAEALRLLLPVDRDPESGGETVAADLVASLSEVSYADELLVLRFLPDESGIVHFRLRRPEWRYDDELRRALAEDDHEIAPLDLDVARARALEDD